MERTKARHLVTGHMNNLWSRWNLTYDSQESWVNVLLPYDVTDAKAAIAQMKKMGESGQRIEPIQKEFDTYIKCVIDSKPKPVQQVVDASEVATLWLICTKRGNYIAAPGHIVPCKPGTGLGLATKEAAEWESLSCIGGKWEVFQGDRSKALARGREIKVQAEQPVADEPLLDQPVVEPEDFDPNRLMPVVDDSIPF